MRQIQEILRLKHQNQLSVREIARSCGLPTSTVGDYLKRAEAAGLGWPLPEGQDEKELLGQLIAQPPEGTGGSLALPDWPCLHQELSRKGVTLLLLWQEYRQAQPEGYGYSRFCELYQRWADTLEPVLRQVHEPGEKMFVDWAGQTVPLHHAQDGSLSAVRVFVAVLGASNKTYVEAFENEQLSAWISAHCQAWAFFQGVSRVTVPDNLNGTLVIPARKKKPRDKAKVEGGVLIAERQILAALRDARFFNVGELNQALAPLLAKLNEQPFQKLEGSRNSWFETLERSQLLPLPALPFELGTWSKAKVNINYHVSVENHFYSAPYQLIHQELDVRLTDKTVELFAHGKRVAAHVRSALPGRATTLEEHRPKSHEKHLQWTPSRILEWVKTIGPECARVVDKKPPTPTRCSIPKRLINSRACAWREWSKLWKNNAAKMTSSGWTSKTGWPCWSNANGCGRKTAAWPSGSRTRSSRSALAWRTWALPACPENSTVGPQRLSDRAPRRIAAQRQNAAFGK